jgi:hypothetical protein
MKAIKFLGLLAFLLLLCLNGCADLNKGVGPLGLPIAGEQGMGTDPMPGQDDATMIVWKWTYGDRATYSAPPVVAWRSGDQCTDDDGKHWNGSFWCPAHKHCCNGYYDVQSAVAYVETWQDQKLSESSLAHELCHAWRFIEGDGTGDGAHSSICFLGSSGAPVEGSLVFEANRRLKAVGL